MAGIPADIAEFMDRYQVDSDEIWQVHGNSWVIKHKALERVAAEQRIKFDRPAFMEVKGAEKIVAMCVFATLGERMEWATGEAAPYNNKNQYPYAMAEKRAKDRVILKLLNAHGALYSEDEADELKDTAAAKPATLAKKDAKDVYVKLQREVDECVSTEQLAAWMKGNKDRITVLPEDWQGTMRLRCTEKLADLRQKEAA